MVIVAKFSSVCPCCSGRIEVGSKVNWAKGSKASHVACGSSVSSVAASRQTAGTPARNYDPNKFNGYGARRGGFRKACVTDGNCSSIGAGRSCGGHDCDGV